MVCSRCYNKVPKHGVGCSQRTKVSCGRVTRFTAPSNALNRLAWELQEMAVNLPARLA
jgi:hypothetical protein